MVSLNYLPFNSVNSLISQILIQTIYWYDAAGERTVKESFDNEGVYVNGALSGARTGTSKFTAYISPYLVVNNGGNYTKHIYVGSQRIVSKLSNSRIFSSALNPLNLTKAGSKDFTPKYTSLTGKIKERFDSLGVAYRGSEQNPEDALLSQTQVIIEETRGEGQEMQGEASFLPPSNPQITNGYKYFYHPDHLGSSSLITNGSGDLVQHIQYVPFGEVFVEERNASWSTPYKFNGKEQDEETGLSYYGARYYDPRTSVWLSVDPLKGKTLNVSAYVYCYNNPVRYIDPDGRFSTLIGALGYKIRYGGTILKDKKTREWFVSQKVDGSKDGSAVVKRVFDRNGRTTPQQQYDQTYSENVYGSGSESYFGNGTSKYHGTSIDANPSDNPAASLTNDAFDLWVNILKKYQDESKWTDFKAGVEMDIPEMNEPEAKVIILSNTNKIIWTVVSTDPYYNLKDRTGQYVYRYDTVNNTDVDSVVKSLKKQGCIDITSKKMGGSTFNKKH